MNSKLFLVCPFSCMENFITAKYGCNVFFLTSMGAIFNFQEREYLQTVKTIIRRKNVDEITVVSDSSCRFIDSTLKSCFDDKNRSQKVIMKLLKDEYAFVINEAAIAEQRIKLAELIIRYQASELMKPDIFGQLIIERRISIKGLITTKRTKQIAELSFNPSALHQGISRL